MTEQELIELIQEKYSKENESVEHKAWTGNFNIDGRPKDDLGSYVSALANEEGGSLLIGVEDKTLAILGITKKKTPEQVSLEVLEKTSPRHKIDIQEIVASDTHKKIWIIQVPKHPVGEWVSFHIPYQRLKESLIELTDKRKEEIRRENLMTYDWSAQVCADASEDDLDSDAMQKTKKIWFEATGNRDILEYNTKQLLKALFDDDRVLNATMVILGKASSIKRLGITHEISFEYRKSSRQIPYDDRKDFQRAFILDFDEIWSKIDARNEIYRFQKGLIIEEIKKFNEIAVREALLNSIAHRDYAGSTSSSQVFIKQSEESIIFINPGKLPTSSPNIYELVNLPSTPRNRKLAEAFQKLQLTNRSGMGVDLITERVIREGKGLPEYKEHSGHVELKLNSYLLDKEFLSYLQKISQYEGYEFNVFELITLEEVRSYGKSGNLDTVENLIQKGLVEKTGAGKGMKYILSRKYYELSGDDASEYIDNKYDKFEYKHKILRFIDEFGPVGSSEVISRINLNVSHRTIQRYLQELVDEKLIEVVNNRGRELIYNRVSDN